MSSREVTREQYATAMLGLKNSANRARGVVSSEIDTLAWYVDTYVTSLEAERDTTVMMLEAAQAGNRILAAERDELRKQLEGALTMYDIRLKKFDDLKARLDEEGFAGE